MHAIRGTCGVPSPLSSTLIPCDSLSPNLKLTIMTRLTGHQDAWIYLFLFSNAGQQPYPTMPSLYVGAVDLNPGPHACTAHTPTHQSFCPEAYVYAWVFRWHSQEGFLLSLGTAVWSYVVPHSQVLSSFIYTENRFVTRSVWDGSVCSFFVASASFPSSIVCLVSWWLHWRGFWELYLV